MTKQIVKKHEILVRNARYSLSELGIKVISVLISMIDKNDLDFKEYSLLINDFKELIGSNSSRTYEYVDKLTHELMSKPFKINDTKFNWVYYAKHSKGDKNVTFKIAPELKPYLLDLKTNFVQYNIINILRLKSSYIIRLYELFKDKWETNKRYKKGNSFSFEIYIDELRENFEIPESYQYSSGIKKRIIEKAKEEFLEKTDIKFDYIEIFKGKKVEKLLITIEDNIKGSNDYMHSLESFIKYMRIWFVNQKILEAFDKKEKKNIIISIGKDGKLYDMKGIRYNKDRSLEIWETLFSMAKEGKLECLK